jgi:hypothetical protein
MIWKFMSQNACRLILLISALFLSPAVSRARMYQANTGRFVTMDTFEGNQQDPLSLHKYLYCHDNPVNGTDPSGLLVVIRTRVGRELNVITGKTGEKEVHVRTGKEFVDYIRGLPDRTIVSIDFIGHGNPQVQGISDKDDAVEAIRLFQDGKVWITGPSLEGKSVLLKNVLEKKVVLRATINLQGCSTSAKNSDANMPNICQAVSQVVPDAFVTGSTFTTYSFSEDQTPRGHYCIPFTERTYYKFSTVKVTTGSTSDVRVNTPTVLISGLY